MACANLELLVWVAGVRQDVFVLSPLLRIIRRLISGTE
jgi:hypothetical protein